MFTVFKEGRQFSIMGIINVNDDSFSGDGSLEVSEISSQINSQIKAGADIIDIGAESARTNREAITEEEELRRLFSILAHWSDIIADVEPRDECQVFPPLLSVNTWRPMVIKVLMESQYVPQIGFINDMSALAFPETLRYIKNSAVHLLIMHSVGLPKQCHADQQWDEVVSEVKTFFQDKIKQASEAGISSERLILDPGLDFAKQSADSLKLIRHSSEFLDLNAPLLYPLSRKNFIGETLQIETPKERDAGTVACLPFLSSLPKCILRVHNVDAVFCATRVMSAF